MQSTCDPALTVSNRLLQPFAKLIASYQLGSSPQLDQLRARGLAARFTLAEAHALLKEAAELSGDPDLGLKAGRIFDLDDAGALAYAASSARTLRQAMDVAGRFLTLVSDATSYRLSEEGERAVVRFESAQRLPRVAADFQASVLRTHHRRTHAVDLPGLEWCFQHAQPASLEEYERTFGRVRLVFSAAYFGFSFDARFLDIPLRTADARLHQLLLSQLERSRRAGAGADTLVDDVRAAILRDLAGLLPSVTHVARELNMSRRTLARRLAAEGTSFRELVDDVRRRMAQHYLGESDRSVAQVASMTGFSEVATFYRAFRRWTRMTPIAYRQQAQAARAAAPAERGETPASS